MGADRKAGGNFNRIAPVYDALAFVVFGRRLQSAQRVFLNRIPRNSTVLIVGGGAGWLLEQILLCCQTKRVVYLETSSQMVDYAARRMVRKGLLGNVEFRVNDESALRTDEHFDVIITPFVLDLFTEATLLTHFIPQLQQALAPGGLWLVTDFVRPAVRWQKAVLWVMIRFFRLIAGIETKTLANWQQCLTTAGLTRWARKPKVGGMVSAEVWTWNRL